jgi:adenosine deaminase
MVADSLGDWTVEQAESGVLSDMHAMRVLARRVPKAELHVHFLGAIRRSFPFPNNAQRLMPDEYAGGADFFARLRRVAPSLTSAAMFEQATFRLLEEHINCGCVHVEVMATPGEIGLSPVPIEQSLAAMGRAFDEIRRYTGVTGGILLETDRADDPKVGFEVVELAMRARDAGAPILGIGNDGDIVHPVIEFGPALEYAKKQGFYTTCHLDTLQDVKEGLELPLDRADHAYDLKGRPELMAQYKARDIPITSALGAVAFMMPGVVKSPAEHPADEFRRFGIRTALGTDDPAFFHTDIAQEYVQAQQAYGWDRRTMVEMAMTSLDMAWIDPQDRDRRLAEWRQAAEGLIEDPRTTNRSPVMA